MKKGLLLSVVASTMIFAGGDIAPVEPAAAAPVADCSDFSGQVGIFYNSYDENTDVDVVDGDLFDKDASSLEIAATIHVEKQIANGIGFGATMGGWTSTLRDTFRAATRDTDDEGYDGGKLGEIYLTGSFGNTAVKVGRFALPGSLSPLLRTDTTNGLQDDTYEGILVANTDLADTTVYGVWVSAVVGNDARTKLQNIDGDTVGAFALGFVNTSIADTKITGVGYYAPEFKRTASDAMAGVLTVNTKVSSFSVTGQVAYIDGDVDGQDATIAAGLNVSTKYDMFGVWAQLEYTNDGDFAIDTLGSESLIADSGLNTTSIKAGINHIALGFGEAYLSAEYRMDNDNDDTKTVATVGYDFKVSGVAFNAEYEYTSTETGANTVDTAEVSLSAVYKF